MEIQRRSQPTRGTLYPWIHPIIEINLYGGLYPLFHPP